MQPLSSFLSWCPSLISVNLSGIHDTGDATLQVLGANCSNLRVLDVMKASKVTDDGIIFLVSRCECLEDLSIRSCSLLTDRSIHAIAKMCTALSRLNVADLPLLTCLRDNVAGLWSLVKFGRTRLRELNAFGCPLVKIADIEALCPYFPLCKVRISLHKGFLGLAARKNADQVRLLLDFDALTARERAAALCIQTFWRGALAKATAASIALRIVSRRQQQRYVFEDRINAKNNAPADGTSSGQGPLS